MLEIGFALILLAALSFAVKDMVSKHALKGNNEWAVNFYINVTMFALSFLYLLISGIPKIPNSVLLPSAIVGGGLAFGTFFFFRALKEGRASIVGPLSTLWAVGVILLAALFFGKPLSLGTAIGSILAFGGILLVALIQHPKITVNIALTVIIWSSWVFAAPVIDEVGPIAALCLFSFFCAAFSLPGIKAKNPASLFVPGLLTFLGFVFDTTATSIVGIVLVASLMMPAYFLFITFGGRVFLHEKINRRELIGLALVCIGIIISSVFS